MKAARLLASLSAVTGTGILVLWVLVWVGAFPVEESAPGFRVHFLSP